MRKFVIVNVCYHVSSVTAKPFFFKFDRIGYFASLRSSGGASEIASRS